MVGDGKAVHLLLDRADEGKNGWICRDGDLVSVRRDERARPVAVILDHTVNRDVQRIFTQDRKCDIRMLHAAVDQKCVRTLGKTRVARKIMRKAPLEHLTHGCIVILIAQPLDPKALIILFAGLSVCEDHHGRHDVRPGGVGNVIRFQPRGRLRKAEHSLQHAQNACRALSLGGDALGLLAGIFLRQLDHAHAVAANRPADVHLLLKLLMQKLLKQRCVLHLTGEQDLLRRRAAGKIILLDKRGDSLLRIVGRLEDLIVLVQKISVYIMQDRKASLSLALVVADHIGARHRSGGHELTLPKRLNGEQTVTQRRRTLKVQRFCR